MLDIRQSSYFADYFVICSAESGRQLRAVCDEVTRVLGEHGIDLYRQEGKAESGWVLLDYGDVIVHVFGPSERDYYDLERLWSTATPVVRIQ